MWDIKLLLINEFYFLNIKIFYLFFLFIQFFNLTFLKSYSFLNWNSFSFLPQNLSLIFSIKFVLCICFLILIRGGTPRYRYDYLTKLGWMKFLSLILLIFLFNIFFYFSL